ncbi:mitochondrial genome maintenance MGM101 [Basidiobolus meristosporus CBS 931.73]|uniref:Mitochondrial genome maintenance protein MGM101 n=1 Tax=Basidiobolus meristosporus CBS 931.73 TaxID=1314790 RepID=A0A1Y1Z531_9FUNG|nr:mitochondrial genome maintenance MGM101 [Basidiobolus meristosporus CBS 931.73]|eukprot:ORY05224.1 mitochondrial genome maintenance MGM101 [Basidiobolus meristosporus CBS 931.73]
MFALRTTGVPQILKRSTLLATARAYTTYQSGTSTGTSTSTSAGTGEGVKYTPRTAVRSTYQARSASAPRAEVARGSINPKINPEDAFPEAEAFNQGTTEIGESWSNSFEGISSKPFPPEVADILLADIDLKDIQIKPDGIVYLPEIKYRRILNRAFGPGGWGLVPRGSHSLSDKTISREWALVCLGQFVSQARGEQDFFDPTGLPTASEGCKSNALMRCCKDLGIASELWDPQFVSKFKREHCIEVWATNVERGNKKKLWKRKDLPLMYPWQAS